ARRRACRARSPARRSRGCPARRPACRAGSGFWFQSLFGPSGRFRAPRYKGKTMSSNDPLLQPFRLKHLTLKNRVMSTRHEPSYSEDGMPKERYRLYHAEKAKGGMALTMTAGSAIVARDSPAAFGNLQAYRDEIVPWMRELADACHEHDCKVMIQLTHLGRRTVWNRADR